MAFVEGIQHAEDDEHTEVRIKRFPISPHIQELTKLYLAGRQQLVGARVRRLGVYVSIPRRAQIQARIQLLVRPGPRRSRRVRTRHDGLGGLRPTSQNEGDQPGGGPAFGPEPPPDADGGGGGCGGGWCTISSRESTSSLRHAADGIARSGGRRRAAWSAAHPLSPGDPSSHPAPTKPASTKPVSTADGSWDPRASLLPPPTPVVRTAADPASTTPTRTRAPGPVRCPWRRPSATPSAARGHHYPAWLPVGAPAWGSTPPGGAPAVLLSPAAAPFAGPLPS